VVHAILWIDRTGAPWRDLPARCGPWKTVYSRFQRWRRAGVWDRVLAALHAEADAAGGQDWGLHFVDGTTVRAHRHAAGAAGTDAETEALGRSRGGFSPKLHLKAEGTG
jgi:transposase